MARATTEVFAEMTVELETTGGALPVPQLISNLTNVAAAVATVPNTALFTTADKVVVTLPPPNHLKSGSYTVGTITGTTNGTIVLTGLDLSALGAPLTQANAAGMTVTPKLGATLVWSKICGITSRTVNRTTTMQQTEVPDCTDETLPNAIEKSVQSQEETISGTGVWAAESHQTILGWWRAGARQSIRVGNTKAPTGAILYEYGPAYLTQVNNVAEKGQKVTSDIQIEFDGLPNVTYAP